MRDTQEGRYRPEKVNQTPTKVQISRQVYCLIHPHELFAYVLAAFRASHRTSVFQDPDRIWGGGFLMAIPMGPWPRHRITRGSGGWGPYGPGR